MKRILIMGLPGSGKTTLAANLTALFLFSKPNHVWFNADTIRERYNDWDFSHEGRIRQAMRMRKLSDERIAEGNSVICDFVAPTNEIRSIFNADFTIWVDTIKESKYEDTNKVFEIPEKFDIRVTEQDAYKWARIIADEILKLYHLEK